MNAHRRAHLLECLLEAQVSRRADQCFSRPQYLTDAGKGIGSPGTGDHPTLVNPLKACDGRHQRAAFRIGITGKGVDARLQLLTAGSGDTQRVQAGREVEDAGMRVDVAPVLKAPHGYHSPSSRHSSAPKASDSASAAHDVAASSRLARTISSGSMARVASPMVGLSCSTPK